MKKLYALLIIPVLATGIAWGKDSDKAKRAEANHPAETTGTGTETRSGDSDITGGTKTSRKTTSESTEATGTIGNDGMTQVPGVRGTTETMTVTKNDYIKSAESKLTNFESRVAKLKSEREGLPATGDRHSKINAAVMDMEKEITETREQLTELKEATSSDWSNYKNRIDANFADLQKSSDGLAAE